MLRAAVTSAFLLLAVVILWLAFRAGTGTSDLFVNLGTEIIGIVITVAVVEWFFERRRLQARARQVAWNVLHTLEHDLWVWQGGPREMDTDEMLGLLHGVTRSDPVPDFTRNLFLSLGTRSKQALKNDRDSVDTLPGLGDALVELGRLSSIREARGDFPPDKIADILEAGALHLARILGLPQERIPASLVRYRDPSPAAQEERYLGGSGGPGTRPLHAPARNGM